MPSPPIPVCFDDAGYTVSGTVILRGVDLIVEPGAVLGVTGPNGAGKTTLLRLAATLHRPTSGRVSVLGAAAGARPDELAAARRSIAMIGHFPALWPELTLRENIELAARLRGGAGQDCADGPLRAVGLSGLADWKASRASLGMQRRVEFARLLTWTPRLLLLDEPYAGLDAASLPLVDEAAARVTEAGGAAILVSHEQERMKRLATRRITVEAGTVVGESA